MSNILSLKIQLFLIITRITRKFIPENKILGITCNRYNKLYVRKLLENSIMIKIIYDSNNRTSTRTRLFEHVRESYF